MTNLLVFFALICSCLGSNILVMMPLSTKSHVTTFMPLFQKLADRGHNMTIVSQHAKIQSRPNWTSIPFSDPLEEMSKIDPKRVNDIIKQLFTNFNRHTLIYFLYSGFLNMTENLLNKGTIQNLVNEDSNFDLMISETLYQQEVFIVFSHIYGIPVINIDAHFPSYWACFLTGNVCPSSFVPNYKSPFSDNMNFFERIENSILNLKELIGGYFYYLPKQEELVRKYFKHPKIESLPPLLSLIKNASLTLVDSHFSQSYPRPYLPNIVEVGGLSISTNSTIDKDLEKLMNESKDGVIYFAFGGSMPMSMFPEELMNQFINAFKELNQTVIMKWDGHRELNNRPNNLIKLKWAPQNGILAHPNCMLFISHGGIHSLTESIYHGVPLLIIPFFSDQEFNAKFAESNGFAYVMDKNNITSDGLLAGINELLRKPSYKRNVLKRSRILKDKPLSPLDTAVYWVEYVLRHKGAPHLRPSSIDMSVYEYIILDFGAIGVLFCLISLAIIYLIVTFILNKIFKH